MKKEEKTRRTYEKIRNAAIVEFGTKSYENASLNTICSENNISKGLLYHNFKGKDDLNKVQEMAIFVALSMVGLALNQMIMWIAVEFFRVFYAVAKIFSTMLVTVYNFISRKLFLEA